MALFGTKTLIKLYYGRKGYTAYRDVSGFFVCKIGREGHTKEAKRAAKTTIRPYRNCTSTNKAGAEERQQDSRCVQMMFPKAWTRDAKLINKFRKEHDRCERCGAKGKYACLEVAHVISKGAGGPDMVENLLKLCGPAAMQKGCHGLDHMGKLSKEEKFALVAKREGITPEECERRVRQRMGYNV